MFLQLIGLTYEIADAREALTASKKEDKDVTAGGNSKPRRFITEPTTYEAFTYLYSFTGLFTGPYYTYQTYVDALNSEHLRTISISGLVTPKLQTLAWSFPLLILFYALGPLEILKTEVINEYSFLTLIVLCALAFIYLRMRIYTAWMIAESICIASGIGIYPKHAKASPGAGPRDLDALKTENGKIDIEYDAETINNLDIPHVESSDGFRSGMRAWNMTVQFWLANFVYKRTRRSIRMPYTMFISAFWHGIHPGYFLSFLTIPLCTAAEDILFSAVKPSAATGKRSYYFELTWRFIRMRGFELMASGFLLLTWTDTVRFWNAVYWWLHLAMVAVVAVAYATILSDKKKSSHSAQE
uniref:Lysophospholipid acyltransferase 7 n=1 Tax=Panagrellus redivivus TaxID=6233 RepID=A0A7E4UX34_PANRE